MKLLLLLLLISLNCFSQKQPRDIDDLLLNNSHTLAITDTIGNSIQLINDSIIVIDGDTTAIIKYVMQAYRNLFSDHMKLQNKTNQSNNLMAEFIHRKKITNK